MQQIAVQITELQKDRFCIVFFLGHDNPMDDSGNFKTVKVKNE